MTGSGPNQTPAPRSATSSSRFWDRIADKYARQPVADEAAYREKLRITRQYLHPGARVWEFGRGTGSTALAHAPHAGHIEATDISAKMIAIAQRKARERGAGNVSFRQASVEESAAPPGAFDMVMAHSILHLVEDRNAAIARAYGALRSGGVFVSSTICLQDEFPLMRYLLPIGRLLGLAPPVQFFTSDALTASLEGAGFVIEHRWHPGRRKALFLIARKP